MTELAIASPSPPKRRGLALPNPVRLGLSGAGAAITLLSLYAVGRWMLGYSSVNPRSVAIAIHIAAVLPAIPLGAYVLFARKGGARHRLLGRIWLSLMLVTAGSAFFIRNVNPGHFSWLHILMVLTLVGVPRAIVTARQGKIRQHRNHLVAFYTGALILAGLTAFAPGRTMWHWAFG